MDKKKIEKLAGMPSQSHTFSEPSVWVLVDKINEIIDVLNREEEKREEGCTCDPLYHYVCPMHARKQYWGKVEEAGGKDSLEDRIKNAKPHGVIPVTKEELKEISRTHRIEDLSVGKKHMEIGLTRKVIRILIELYSKRFSIDTTGETYVGAYLSGYARAIEDFQESLEKEGLCDEKMLKEEVKLLYKLSSKDYGRIRTNGKNVS